MQLTTTIITLLGAASLTLAAPTRDSTYSSNAQYSNVKADTIQPPVIPVPTTTEESTASASSTSNIQALLQLELERQTTFIQRQVPVPGRIALNLDTLFSAFIVSVEDASTGEDVNIGVTCQALDAQGRAVGAPIGADAGNADLNGGEAVQIGFIECLEVEGSSS
ncbi:hypothetical protein QBC37DRAFT_426823 [Rhypophila decipiens]|uniref:Uncharacterized protein n=1 Tax=Rhypophila decipiens TaxID=261697 RepID=A0AAN6Y539_9PEZI|nr:hypothetical protein QBC37DRAFT_426823 [Rhypophila decipiens]